MYLFVSGKINFKSVTFSMNLLKERKAEIELSEDRHTRDPSDFSHRLQLLASKPMLQSSKDQRQRPFFRKKKALPLFEDFKCCCTK